MNLEERVTELETKVQQLTVSLNEQIKINEMITSTLEKMTSAMERIVDTQSKLTKFVTGTDTSKS